MTSSHPQPAGLASTDDKVLQKLLADIRGFGARFDLALNDATRALYEPHLEVAPAEIEKADLAYGPHARHRLDVFSVGGKDLPVVLYVHGGGFVGGDKRATPNFYANVGRYLASKGFLALTMNYRLGGTDPWPAGRDDVGAVVEWIAKNAATLGGDANRLGLVGQSSGCCHVASYLFEEATAAAAARQVRAAVLMSGYYKVKPPLAPGQQAYFGTDATQFELRSPATHVARSQVPVMLTLAQYDPPAIAQQTLEFASALTGARGACPPLHWLAGHNHVSGVLSIGTIHRDSGELLEAFLQAHLAGAPAA